MDLKYFENKGEDVYELSLKGRVGDTLNGDLIAQEIDFLNTIGAKVIKQRINSVGGGIINGFSIIESNLNSKAEIHTINGGMAGSIMSAVLASGTPGKRFAWDYSTAVIHNPSFDGVSLENIEDEKEKEQLQKLKDSIVQIYVNNTKMTKSQSSKMMTEDKLLNSKEQEEIGLVDEILPSKMQPVLSENMSYAEIMNVCNDKENFITTEIPKQKKMSELTKFYNLVEEADEAAILKKAQEDRSKRELAENKVLALEKASAEKDTEISNLKKEVEKYQNEAIETAVDAHIEAGKFLKENRESVLENATNIGLKAFNTFVESIPVKTVNVLDQVVNQSNHEGDKKTKDQKLAEEYQKLAEENPIELENIKIEDRKRFDLMFNAWNK